MQKFQISNYRAVANWVLIGIIMLLVQVILGGITRLTGSGLSITEWDILTGTLPPLSGKEWAIEFAKYKQHPQFLLLNSDFHLADFKFIFFWEWFHRFWGRMVGIVFIVGFIYLLFRRKLKADMIRPLLIMFLLGALQGAIGWIMVASGLNGDAIYVNPIKLALHFVFALALISYACWFYFGLTVPTNKITRNATVRNLEWAILVLLFFQLIYGALMAGYKAANSAPTWPGINGEWMPSPASRRNILASLFEDKLMIHFIHRGLAYLLLILTVLWTVKVYTISGASTILRKNRWLPLSLISFQVSLGIAAVLSSPGIIPNHWVAFDWIAQCHQIIGMIYLLIMIYMLYIVRPERRKL